MNARQFLGGTISLYFSRNVKARRILQRIAQRAFPEAKVSVVRPTLANRFTVLTVASLYMAAVYLLFNIQAVLALSAETFTSNGSPSLIGFLNDTWNIVNYTFTCPAYCVLGLATIYAIYNLGDEIRQGDDCGLGRPNTPSYRVRDHARVVLAGLFFGTVNTFWFDKELLANHAQRGDFFWFMGHPAHPFAATPGHLYYLAVNTLLFALVAWAAISHVGLFQIAGRLVGHLENVASSKPADKAEQLLSEDNLVRWLAPFFRATLLSKSLILLLFFNLFTWRQNTLDATPLQISAKFSIYLLGFWLSSLPQHYLQYNVYELRKRFGHQGYYDLRPAWHTGWSAVLNLLLIVIAEMGLFARTNNKILEFLSDI